MSKLSRNPHKPRIMDGRTSDAWWYENEHNIEVHVEHDGGHSVLRINRKVLESWIQRTRSAKP